MNIMSDVKYVITGTLLNGRRFSPIYTKQPWNYNIWNGTIWLINPETGKRVLYQRIYN